MCSSLSVYEDKHTSLRHEKCVRLGPEEKVEIPSAEAAWTFFFWRGGALTRGPPFLLEQLLLTENRDRCTDALQITRSEGARSSEWSTTTEPLSVYNARRLNDLTAYTEDTHSMHGQKCHIWNVPVADIIYFVLLWFFFSRIEACWMCCLQSWF